MSAPAIEALLHQARLCRAQSDVAGAERALAEASTLDAPDSNRTRVRWKWAKALTDLGRTTDALAVLRQVELPLFEGYPQAFRGARRLARLHQERVGYAADALPWLWTQLVDATARDRDADTLEVVLLDRAWCHACRGALGAMEADLHRVQAREQAALYTRLCAANWTLDGATAEEVAPDLQGGSEHVETALYEARLRFGVHAPPVTTGSDYLTALLRGHGFGELPKALRPSGPEFALAAHQSGVLAGELEPPTERYGCAAFTFEAPTPGTR